VAGGRDQDDQVCYD